MVPFGPRTDIPPVTSEVNVPSAWIGHAGPNAGPPASSRATEEPPRAPIARDTDIQETTASDNSGSISGYREWLGHHELPAWFVSLIVHTLVLILLILLQIPPRKSFGTSLIIRMTESSAETDSATIEMLPPSETIAMEEPAESAVVTDPLPSNAQAIVIESPLPNASQPSVTASTEGLPDLRAALTAVNGAEIMSVQLPKGGVHKRDAASRASLGARFGSTPESEDAVEAALRWLAAHQQRDGSWSFDLSQEPCRGQCRHSQSDESLPRPATAATGLALLAFLGAGYHHHEGKYQDQVQRGLYFLREEAAQATSGYDLQGGSMYGHGIAMLAISEAMAMTRYLGKQDADLFALTQGGSRFTASAQHSLGGWRYVPGSPGDMTVTAWQVLSLISAQHGGVALPTPTLPRAEQFIRGLSKPQAYAFGYQSVAVERTSTAVGLCTLMYLGQSPHDEPFARALNQLSKRGPKFTDVYHDYYATMALHHARHRDWEKWHVPIREHLIKTQATKGHEAGSWHFPDKNGDVGGRLYTTAMCAMTLEVYYRYLPLYQSRDEFKLD